MTLTVGKRLGLGFLTVCACLIGIVALNRYYSKEAKSQATLVREETSKFAMKAKDMQFWGVQVQQWLTDISATQGKDGLNDGFEKAEENAVQFRQAINEFREMFTRENDQKALADLKKLEEDFDGYYSTGKKMAAAYVKGGPEAGNPWMEKFDPYAEQITTSLDAFVKDQTDELESAMTSIVSGTGTTMLVGLIAGIGGVAISILIAWLTARSITRPLRKVGGVLDTVAQGDYSRKADIKGKDELAQMAAALKRTNDAIATAMNDVTEAAQREQEDVVQRDPDGHRPRVLDPRHRVLDAAGHRVVGGLLGREAVHLEVGPRAPQIEIGRDLEAADERIGPDAA